MLVIFGGMDPNDSEKAPSTAPFRVGQRGRKAGYLLGLEPGRWPRCTRDSHGVGVGSRLLMGCWWGVDEAGPESGNLTRWPWEKRVRGDVEEA